MTNRPPTQSAGRWAGLALAAVALATAAAWLAPAGWPFELFSHFRMHLAVASALLVPALLVFGRWRAAGIAAGIAALPLLSTGPALRAAEPDPACAGESLVVVTANLDIDNDEHARFIEWLAGHPADVVVLQEVNAAWARDLAAIRGYPYRRVIVREDPYGIAVLSRRPVAGFETLDLARDGLPALAGDLEIGAAHLRLLGVHTLWPITPGLAARRDRALMKVAAIARATPGPLVAAGDLNLTPDSPVWPRLLADSHLRDVFAGRAGWHPTWRAGFWPLALRIDHVLVSRGVCVERPEVGPEIGSDHRPVVVRLRVAGAA
ncbi:MAG TPA: endonuclease/exonuclease/phosphatase family protein [Steroidobacteraceae bacterium]|nr:endonuclease/exonuclease/phosphatase family protein [Steroidobacteraceae bacterium]